MQSFQYFRVTIAILKSTKIKSLVRNKKIALNLY